MTKALSAYCSVRSTFCSTTRRVRPWSLWGRELTCYISDIEGLFTRHSINANADKKKWFIYYPGLVISEFWESLPEYSDAAKTYENFKDAVIAQYPDASTTRKYERHDLKHVIGKYA